MNAPSQRIAAPQRGHLFRSELVDSIARLEKWTLHVLQSVPVPAGSKNSAKIPQFVTQRVKSVKDLEGAHPRLMHSWEETKSLLDQLEQFWTLRSALVHAVMTATIGHDGTAYFTFESTGATSGPVWDRRKTLSEAELSPIVKEVGLLIDRLCEQFRRPTFGR